MEEKEDIMWHITRWYSVIIYMLSTCVYAQQAVICVPVADLFGEPLTVHIPELGRTIPERYQKIPHCGGTSAPGTACPRVHQLLFHEIVTVNAAYEHQACIDIPHLFYVTPLDKQPQHTYWTLKSNLILLSDIHALQPSALLPTPFNFNEPHKLSGPQPVIALIKPWRDKKLNITLSAGTKFIHVPLQDTQDTHAVYRLHPKQKKLEIIHIPRAYCLTDQEMSHEDRIKLFLTIVRQWAQTEHGRIPYVWGGCSYATHVKDDIFEEVKLEEHRARKTSLYRWKLHNQPIKQGFDCVGLVVRAAQLSGIPFFYKNTFTLSLYLDPLTSQDKLEDGDLIWIPGHVMIVSDVAKGLLIEARGYTSGYGIIHEIPIGHVFKDIVTYDQLVAAFHSKTPLIRLNKQNQEVETEKNFKILKLSSVWKTRLTVAP